MVSLVRPSVKAGQAKPSRRRFASGRHKKRLRKKTRSEIHADWRLRMEAIIIQTRPRLKKRAANLVTHVMHKLYRSHNNMQIRSKRAGIKCGISIDELMEMYLSAYCLPCRYCGRTMTEQVMVFDHVIPISKKGETIRENLQIICKACNHMKGSFLESEFNTLLSWLETQPEAFAKSIKIRLAGGIA